MGTKKPVSRKDEIVVQEIDGEALIYDLRDNRALCLNETSAMVWRACDGTKSVDDIGKIVSDEDVVWLALEQLKSERLIDSAPTVSSKFNGMGRREVIKKIGLGAMVALPVVASLVAPTGVQAASCTPGGACTCQGPNGGTGNVCTTTASTCNPGCVCRFANNGNLTGVCGP